MKDSTQTVPQFCIIENAIALAVKKRYCLAVHTPYKTISRRTGFYSGIQLRNIELYLVRDWIERKYNVWCWVNYHARPKKHIAFSRVIGINDDRIKYKWCNSYPEALALAITEVLKTI